MTSKKFARISTTSTFITFSKILSWSSPHDWNSCFIILKVNWPYEIKVLLIVSSQLTRWDKSVYTHSIQFQIYGLSWASFVSFVFILIYTSTKNRNWKCQGQFQFVAFSWLFQTHKGLTGSNFLSIQSNMILIKVLFLQPSR